MKIVFFGSDSFVIPVLQALQEHFEVAGAVTAPKSAVSQYFKGKVFTPERLDENFKLEIKNLKFDLGVVASYGKIIPQDILDLPKYGFLNVHPSLLPLHRGASPVPDTILTGDKKTGVTIIKMDQKMDHGPIIYTSVISLSGKEDTPTLITKLFQLGAEALVDVIPQFIEGKVKLTPQNHKKATFCKMMKKEDGYFDLPAGRQVSAEFLEELDRMIRAYSPWPGVWTKWQAKIVKFLPNNMIQMEGKKPVSLKDFLNGYPDFPQILSH